MPETEPKIYSGISAARLGEILERIKMTEIGFVGDLCIDIYWIADMKKSELSRETPHFPLPVAEERFQLGAGGNVIANIAALRPKAIHAVSVIGDDWRGMLIRQQLERLRVSMETIIVSPGKLTNAYCKPIRRGISRIEYEDPRIDFTADTPDEETQRQVINLLGRMAERVSVICVSDQFAGGCVTPAVREEINRIAKQGKPVVVDSRDRIAQYRHAILKPNEVECIKAAAHLAGVPEQEFTEKGFAGYVRAGGILREHLGCDLSVTLGSNGNLQIHDGEAIHILPRDVKGPLDFCGAGDTFLSAYSTALAAGADREQAGQIGSMASEVTIRKVNQTGTATLDEILNRFETAYSGN